MFINIFQRIVLHHACGHICVKYLEEKTCRYLDGSQLAATCSFNAPCQYSGQCTEPQSAPWVDFQNGDNPQAGFVRTSCYAAQLIFSGK